MDKMEPIKQNIKNKYKRLLSFLVALCLTMGLVLHMSIPAQAANYWAEWTVLPTTANTQLSTGNYRVNATSGTVTITATTTGQSGLRIASNATVTIYIPSGVTLEVNGANGSDTTGAGAGIHLASGATLIIRGAGTLNVKGGAGDAAQSGGNGGAGSISSTVATSGIGGAGGRGGGGGGAGIGSNGAAGGAGGGGGAARSFNLAAFEHHGNNGSAGSTGGGSTAAGTVYILDTITVTANGGSGGSAGSAGTNNTGIRTVINTSPQRAYYAGGGGGGGGGAAGGAGSGIGTGGFGGAGGGGGGSGGLSHSQTGNNFSPNPNGGQGGTATGNTNRTNGTRIANSNDTSWAKGGDGANGSTVNGTKSALNGSLLRPASGTRITASPAGATAANTTAHTLTTTAVTNMTVSATTPINGTAFHATLTPNAGYSRPTAAAVTVRMGGVTQTGVYTQNTGIITIPNVTGNIEITAAGVAQSYEITLGVNGGTAGTGGTTHSVTHMSVPNNIPANRIPTRPNHIFNGFWTAASSGSRVFDTSGAAVASIANHTNASRQWIGTSDITLQAQWLRVHNVNHTGENATITNTGTNVATQGSAWTGTLTASAGYTRPSAITVTRGTANITSNVTYNSGTGLITIPAEQVTLATAGQAFTITAAGVPNMYTITFYAGGGEGTMADQSFTYGMAQNLTANTFTRTGHTFTGWNTVEDGSGTHYADSQSVNNLTSVDGVKINLYAQWNINDFEGKVDVQDNTANFTVDSDNLAELFNHPVEDYSKGVTDEEMQHGNSVLITLNVRETCDDAAGAEEITERTRGRLLQFFEITVDKTVTTPTEFTTIRLRELPVPIQITITLSKELSGKTGYTVYRFHNEQVQLIGMDTDADEYFTVSRSTGEDDVDQVIINTRRFSTYAVVENIRTIDAPGNEDVDVKARIIDLTTPVYKIDIEWGDMKFIYNLTPSAGTWNPDTMQYEGAMSPGWHGMDDFNNRVRVSNHSNADVNVSFAVANNGFNEAVTMNVNQVIDDTDVPAIDMPLGKVPLPNGDAPEIVAFLRLSGVPSQDDIDKMSNDIWHKVGIITVTITPDGEVLTPRNLRGIIMR